MQHVMWSDAALAEGSAYLFGQGLHHANTSVKTDKPRIMSNSLILAIFGITALGMRVHLPLPRPPTVSLVG